MTYPQNQGYPQQRSTLLPILLGAAVVAIAVLTTLLLKNNKAIASSPTEQDSPAVTSPLSSQNLTCDQAFEERGATKSFAKEICADTQPGGQAERMVAGQVCEGYGTVTYDNQTNVWIKKNFSENGKVAFYAYCYPNGADIRFAPFFVGSELSPVNQQVFTVVYPTK